MNIKQKIFDIGKTPQLLNLATITEFGKPWVRYTIGNMNDKLEVRISARLSSRKVKQIKKNPSVHLSIRIEDSSKVSPWLQLEGSAEISTDASERHLYWNDGLKEIFKSKDDPEYAVIIIKPDLIELNSFGLPNPELWKPEK